MSRDDDLVDDAPIIKHSPLVEEQLAGMGLFGVHSCTTHLINSCTIHLIKS